MLYGPSERFTERVQRWAEVFMADMRVGIIGATVTIYADYILGRRAHETPIGTFDDPQFIADLILNHPAYINRSVLSPAVIVRAQISRLNRPDQGDAPTDKYTHGDRVQLNRTYLSVPSGSKGTVQYKRDVLVLSSAGEILVLVGFDNEMPHVSVAVPNEYLDRLP